MLECNTAHIHAHIGTSNWTAKDASKELMQDEALQQTLAPAWFEPRTPGATEPEYIQNRSCGRWHAKTRTTAQKKYGEEMLYQLHLLYLRDPKYGALWQRYD